MSAPEGKIEDFQAQIVNERRFAKAVVREFAAAVLAGDYERCGATFEALDHRVLYGWRRAMRAVANTPAPDDFRVRFLQAWDLIGDHLPSEVEDDLVLINAMWSLLPRYIGPATAHALSRGRAVEPTAADLRFSMDYRLGGCARLCALLVAQQ